MQEMTSDGKPDFLGTCFGGEGLGLNSWAGRRAPHHGVHARDDVRWSIWEKNTAVHPRKAGPAAPFRGLLSRRCSLWRLRRASTGQQAYRMVLFSMLSLASHHICRTAAMRRRTSGSVPMSWATPFSPPSTRPPHPPNWPTPQKIFY